METDEAFMSRRKDHDKFWMRAGMAKAALTIKRERDLRDVHNQPLSYAKRMSDGHSEKTLEKWARHSRKTIISV